MDMQGPFARRHAALIQDDLVALDPPHVTEPNDVFDLTKQHQLRLANHRAAAHGRRHGRIDAKEELLGFQLRKQIRNRRCVCHGLELDRDAFIHFREQ